MDGSTLSLQSETILFAFWCSRSLRELFEQIKLDFSDIGGQVGLNFVKQTLDIVNQFCLQMLWKEEVLEEL